VAAVDSPGVAATPKRHQQLTAILAEPITNVVIMLYCAECLSKNLLAISLSIVFANRLFS
jgi:hypothetical protein